MGYTNIFLFASPQVEAAIALQMMLTNQQEELARTVVGPQIGEITMKLLQVIRETENDDLTSVMQKIICTYTEQLIPLAVNICNNLMTTFAQVKRKILFQYKYFINLFPSQVLESNDQGDEKAITAMGLLNTMETILTVMEDTAVHSQLEPIVLQVK